MLKLIGAIILTLLLLFITGIVISDLWLWFIVPLGILSISNAQGIGISLLVGLLTLKPAMALNKEIDGITVIATTIITTLICWGMGAIVHLFM
jgi:hypothetical protein